MISWEAVFAKYAWIWVGLSFGFAAKYALLLKKGVRVRVRLVLADLMLLPTVFLIAYNLCLRAGATSELAALITTFCTVGADRLIKLMTEYFWRKLEAATLQATAREIVESRGELRQAVQTVDSAQELVERRKGL